MQSTWWETGLRLLVALASAALIGWEREAKDRPAGLRTHILVGLGACLFTILALDLYHRQGAFPELGATDPQKVISGVVGGIGFLGAGAILQSRGRIHGLTTAAGIWVVAAIGVAAGCGHYSAVGMTTALALVVLYVLAKLEVSTSDGDPAAKTGDD